MTKVSVSLTTEQASRQEIETLKAGIAAELAAIDDNLSAAQNITTVANCKTAILVILERQRRLVKALGYVAKNS